MLKIKIGQIREDMYGLYIITYCEVERSLYSVIYHDGIIRHWSAASIKDDILIAEYPTWQEAVNSKEFNYES